MIKPCDQCKLEPHVLIGDGYYRVECTTPGCPNADHRTGFGHGTDLYAKREKAIGAWEGNTPWRNRITA